jgi:hypothetical protein
MAYKNRDWYEHLVEQSKTNLIYSLIHEYIEHDWDPGHDIDFVTLCPNRFLMATGYPFDEGDISKALAKSDYSFPSTEYVLLDNNNLTRYLELARAMIIIEDKDGREFIELLFVNDLQADVNPIDEDIHTAAASWDGASDKDGAVFGAYERLKVPCEKEEAYRYAQLAELFLDSKRVPIVDNVDASLYEAKRILFGYNVVAMVYVWNDKMEDAAIVDSYYILYPHVWNELEDQIDAYLGLLMAKQQRDYLKYLFSDKLFRKRFLAHYEAYISLMVDDTYPLTRMREVVRIINRVNNAYSGYL